MLWGSVRASRAAQAYPMLPWGLFTPSILSRDGQDLYLRTPLRPFESTEGALRRAGEQGVQAYEVVRGDTLSEIAAAFGLQTETLLWANDLSDADLLSIGQRLRIPPVDGVIHQVQEGDTLESLAAKYKVEPSAIQGYAANGLKEAGSLVVGSELIIPGGEKEERWRPRPAVRGVTRPQVIASSAAPPSAAGFAWPTYGPIFQYFSGYHPGIDISPPYGTPVYAAASGRVVETPRTRDFGLYVLVDHGDGFRTMYSHLSGFAVEPGEGVERGELLGWVGTSGIATGPHLDFRIFANGVAVNPLSYLP